MSQSYFKSGITWLDELMPQGLAIPSSNLISGPAGAGKPLIGALFVDAWLKSGGTLIHLLINFKREYAENLLRHFDPSLKNSKEKIVFIEFDPLLEGIEKSTFMSIKANLLKPEIFDEALRVAASLLPESQMGSLLYGSAMNMLLFSETYGRALHKRIVEILKGEQNILFTVSNNVLEEQVEKWENTADNVFYTHGTGIMHLAFKIVKMKDTSFSNKEVEVPLSEDELYSIRTEAEQARMNLIPVIRRI